MEHAHQLKIRLPADAKAFIEDEAKANASSQNSEIIRAVREAMKAKGAASAATDPRHGSTNPERNGNEHSQQ